MGYSAAIEHLPCGSLRVLRGLDPGAGSLLGERHRHGATLPSSVRTAAKLSAATGQSRAGGAANRICYANPVLLSVPQHGGIDCRRGADVSEGPDYCAAPSALLG